MTTEKAIALVEQLSERGRLTKVQEILFTHFWAGKTYVGIANKSGCGPGHIKDVGADLWRVLFEALNERVTKHNLNGVLTRAAQRQTEPTFSPPSNSLQQKPDADWSKAIDTSHFYGRSQELKP